MSQRDEFDGPAPSDTIGAIFKAMEKRDAIKPRRRTVSVVILLALVAFVASVFWYSYPRGDDAAEMAVPVIRADVTAFREVPDDPGGMDIPYRDSTVFDTMRAAENEGARIENLLAEESEEDTPLSREQLFAGLKTDLTEDLPRNNEEAAQMADEDPAPAPEAIKELVDSIYGGPSVPPSKPGTRTAQTLNDVEPAATTQPKEDVVINTPVTKGEYYIQLASLTSENAANTEWRNLEKQHNVLSGLPHRVQRADLGEKGIYFRIQAGPFAESDAQKICNEIKTKKPGGCLVLKP